MSMNVQTTYGSDHPIRWNPTRAHHSDVLKARAQECGACPGKGCGRPVAALP